MPLLHSNPTLIPLRCFAAEMLAYTVVKLFPNVLLIKGEETDIGFYYDFIFEQPVDTHLLELIEVQMRGAVKERKEIRMLNMMRENAANFFSHHDQPFLAERALDEEFNIISIIQIDAFHDICTPLEIEVINDLACFKLLSVKPQTKILESGEEIEVTRITGTAFDNPQNLKQFLKAYEKGKKGNHLTFGLDLELFEFVDQMGKISPVWYPRGEQLRLHWINRWKQECLQRNIEIISTPQVTLDAFLKDSESLLPPFEWQNQEYSLANSHLNHHLYLAQKMKKRPLRLGELTTVYSEVSEAQWSGLFRSCSYLTELVTVFCSDEEVPQELIYSLQFIKQNVTIFGSEVYWILTRDAVKKSTQSKALQWLEQALQQCEIAYTIEEGLAVGVEVKLADPLGRGWKGGSIEIRPSQQGVTLIQSLLGSVDCLVALLVEKYKGEFPLWLAPEQVRVLVMGEANRSYAEDVYRQCKLQGFRVQLEGSSEESLGARIYEAEKEKIPYLLIVGNHEREKNKVTVRSFQDGNRTTFVTLDDILDRLRQECHVQSSEKSF